MKIFGKEFFRRRDAPVGSVVITNSQAYNMICCDGYMPLSKCPEVMACVNAYADLISSMTIHLMENTPNGDKRIVNELSRKIDIEPCENMGRKQWIYTIVKSMMLDGNGNQVTLVDTTRDGLIRNLIPVPPSAVSYVNKAGAEYEIVINGKAVKPENVLHFVDNPDTEQPWIGKGVSVSLKDVIGCIRQANGTKQSLLKSPVPSIIVQVDGLSEDFSSAKGREKLQEQYLSASENGKPWFIPSEAFSVTSVKPLTISDLAIKDNLELDKRTVAALFGVPPFLVGVGSYNEDEYNNFVNTKIMAKAQIIQQELTRKLLLKPEWYFKFNPRSLYNYKLPELIEAGKEMTSAMAMTRNEWRDWVGLSPRDDMEEIVALENYIPVDRLGDQKKLNGNGGE